eukprot:UN04367
MLFCIYLYYYVLFNRLILFIYLFILFYFILFCFVLFCFVLTTFLSNNIHITFPITISNSFCCIKITYHTK